MPRYLIIVAVSGLLLVTAAVSHIYWQLQQPLPITTAVDYDLVPGTSLHQLAYQLHELGVLPKPKYLILYARIQRIGQRLQAGEYRLQPGISALEVLHKLQQGDVLLHSFTIVEGWTFRQLREALSAVPTLTHRLSANTQASAVMALLGHPEQHPEGQFYPDTYFFPKQTTDLAFLERAYNTMQQRLRFEWQQRAPDTPLKSPYQALILASIIERETGVPAERPLIAAVFINRLRRNMRLQTDPTVIYGLGEDFDGDIKFRDLRRDTPYNTYTRAGLPPTPIAMPSGAAIHAALHPVDSDVLYFVAKGDGSHQFSTNLTDHEAAVDRYQRLK